MARRAAYGRLARAGKGCGAVVAALLVSATAWSVGPPTAEEMAKLNAAGVLQERLDRAERFGMNRFQAGLQQKAVRRMEIEAAKVMRGGAGFGPVMAFPTTTPPELKSRGAVKTLTILIDFADHRAGDELPGLAPQNLAQNVYGNGTEAAQAFVPYESLNAYYRRASENKVNVQGEVLGWYHFPKNRSDYEPQSESDAAWNRALLDVVAEALKSFDAEHDFAQYDNDHDEDIDLVTVLYAGPATGWMSFWWAYRWEFFVAEADQTRLDGKRFRQFVFQYVSLRAGSDFDPRTLIHEMGHAFGLPDYYDYRPGVGPDGGLGGLDMMDANQGNHNGFSRWLLDWIQPEVIASAAPAAKTLVAASGTVSGTKAMAVFPDLADSDAPSRELFLIENRFRTGNDGQAARMPNDGLLIWHVDATPNSDRSDFLMNNSDTEHKLIRLVRADSVHDFADGESAGSGTYYVPGKRFTPTSAPASLGNNGVRTGVSVDQIVASGEAIEARIGIERFEGGGSPAKPAVLPRPPHPPGSLAGKVAAAWNLPPGKKADLAELEVLLAEFQEQTPQQLQATWDAVYDARRFTGKTDEASLVLRVLLTQLAAKNGKTAIGILLQLPPGDFASRAFPEVLEAWAANAPLQAAQWYCNAKQRAIRTSERLIAGESFTRTAFQALARKDAAKAIAAIDCLTRVSEIAGAVEGIRQAAQDDGQSLAELDGHFQALQQNADAVRAWRQAQEALSHAERQIADPRRRAEFRDFLRLRRDR